MVDDKYDELVEISLRITKDIKIQVDHQLW